MPGRAVPPTSLPRLFEDLGRPATLADLEALPAELEGEIVEGEVELDLAFWWSSGSA